MAERTESNSDPHQKNYLKIKSHVPFSFPYIIVDSFDVRVLGHGEKLNYFQVYLTVKNDVPEKDKRFLLKTK